MIEFPDVGTRITAVLLLYFKEGDRYFNGVCFSFYIISLHSLVD